MSIFKKIAGLFALEKQQKKEMKKMAPPASDGKTGVGIGSFGKCGDLLTWRLKKDTLYIQGTGAMSLYRTEGWFPRGNRIRKAIITSGCTTIGNAAFEGCEGLTSVQIPNTVSVISWSAFRGCVNLTDLVIPDSVQVIGKDALKDVPNVIYHGPARSEDNWGAKCLNGIKTPAAPKLEPEQSGKQPAIAAAAKENPAPGTVSEPFTLEFHFKERRESDLETINQVLSRYTLSKVEFIERKGYLATETTTEAATGRETVRYWYGLDDCVLRCTPAKPGEGLDFRISTMTADKSTQDCALLWRENNPGRMLSYKVFLEYESVYALIFIHYLQKPGTEKREIIQRSSAPKAVPAPKSVPAPQSVSAPQSVPVQLDPDSHKCGDNLTWRKEGGTLYIEGQGKIDNWAFGSQYGAERYRLEKVVIGSGCTEIGNQAFYDCFSLREVQLPEGLKKIGDRAFCGCINLKCLALPESVTDIGSAAFLGCWKLTDLEILGGLKTVGEKAFAGCHELRYLNIPSSVTEIGENAFNMVPHIFYNGQVQSDNNWGARKWTKEWPEKSCGGDLIWWKEEDVLYIKGTGYIWEHAFNGDKSIRKVVIDPGCTGIGGYAFYDCSNLEEAELPDTLKCIERNAFCYCERLKVQIPASVTAIERDAFWEVAQIFYSGPDESTVHWGAENFLRGSFCLENEALYITGEGVLGAVPCFNVPTVVIESEKVDILANAFAGWTKLKTVVLPKRKKITAAEPFPDSEQVTLVFPRKEETFIEDPVPESVNRVIYTDCVHGKERIRDEKKCCWYLKEDTLYIGGKGELCRDLVRYIDHDPNPEELPEYLYDAEWTYESYETAPWHSVKNQVKRVVVGSGITAICEHLLYYHAALESVHLPRGLETIGSHAFEGCTSLRKVRIPLGVTYIGSDAFSGCSALELLGIPFTVKTIGPSAFRQVPSIFYCGTARPENVETDENWGALSWATELPSQPLKRGLRWRRVGDMVYIEGQGDLWNTPNTFWRDLSIREVIIGPGCRSIGRKAFSGCSALERVTLPEGLEKIHDMAFENCTALKEVTLPGSVTEIGEKAFFRCTGLEKVTFERGSVVEIGAAAFAFCYALTELTIPDDLKQISRETFRGCSNLKKLVIPKGTEKIGRKAFQNCAALTELEIPGNVMQICQKSFAGCKGLEKVTIHSGLKAIPKGAFEDCTALTQLQLPDTMEKIQPGAFDGCESLDERCRKETWKYMQ